MSEEIRGVITWLYYHDVQKVMDFYTNVMGFKYEVDQGWSKILKIRDGAYLGVVDEKYGYHRASPEKPVMLCLNVKDLDYWYNKLSKHGVEVEEMPKESERLRIKVFVIKDPEGYDIEIQQSLKGAISI